MARPTKLTDALIEQARTLLADCPLLSVLAARLKVCEWSVYHWKKLGEAEQRRRDSGRTPDSAKDHLVEFSQTIKEAHAEYKCRTFAELGVGASGWQAKAWQLERLWRDEFGELRKEIADQERRIARLEKARDG